MGAHQVLQASQLVRWRDGSSVRLHQVQHLGAPSSRLRALAWDGGWVVIDLLRLQPELLSDFNRLPPSDWDGLVFYTLRLGYQGAGDFQECALRAGVARVSTSTTAAAAA